MLFQSQVVCNTDWIYKVDSWTRSDATHLRIYFELLIELAIEKAGLSFILFDNHE